MLLTSVLTSVSIMLALKVLSLVFLLAISSPANGHSTSTRKGNCPIDWFTAQFVSLADVVVPGESLVPVPDPEYSFFRNIMRFDDKKIEKVAQEAIEFMKTKFGVDFSQSTPDMQQRRTNGPAFLQPFFLSKDIPYTINLNTWILNRKPKNFCFENRDGGFVVQFTDSQMLHGTYGGEEGIPISPGDLLLYGFYNIAMPYYHTPVIIRYQSNTPLRSEPVDGLRPINCELYHERLGDGVAQGAFRVMPTDEPNQFHVSIRNVITFPAHPGLN